MAKEKVTFDQVFRSYVYEQLLIINKGENNFKVINDSSMFNESDMIENYSIVMIKTYGGTRVALPDIDATPLSVQLIVNTDEPQKWKRIITEFIDNINGKWNTLKVTEDEKYKEVEYQYMPTLNIPSVISGTTQVNISTRHNIQCVGSIFYTSNPYLLSMPRIDLIIDGETHTLNSVLSCTLGYTNVTETYPYKEEEVLKSENMGASRAISINLLLNLNSEAHRYLMERFFNNDLIDKEQDIIIYLDGNEFMLSTKTYITSFTSSFINGGSTTVQIQLVESGD